MSVPTFPLSFRGATFICTFESFKDKPYQDSGGLWTIGYGTQLTELEVQKYKGGISKETGLFLFSKHNAILQQQLAKTPFCNFEQWQKDALISLSYNIGFSAFQSSTIYRHLVNRDVDLSPWLLFVKDNKGQVQAGLQRRRHAEVRLFVYNDYSTD